MAQCTHTKPDGTRCGATARRGRRCCVFHDKASAARTAEGRRRGGLNRKVAPTTLPPDAPDLPLRTMHDVVALLEDTINRVRTGRLGVAVGNSVGQLAMVLQKCLERADLEARILVLEQRANNGRKR